jgi:hypothetical protein
MPAHSSFLRSLNLLASKYLLTLVVLPLAAFDQYRAC